MRTARTQSLDTPVSPRAKLPTGGRPNVQPVGHFIPVPVIGLYRWNQAVTRHFNRTRS